MQNQFTQVPEGEPSLLMAGDTWLWKRTDLSQLYAPALYALSYALKRVDDTVSSPTSISGSMVTAPGGIFTITVPPATTAPLSAGLWGWTSFITRLSDSSRVTIANGVFHLVPDRASDKTDSRSFAEKSLAAIEAVITGRASKDVMSYSISGRSLSKMSPADLITWRNYFRSEVNKERAAENARAGRPTGRIIAARFH